MPDAAAHAVLQRELGAIVSAARTRNKADNVTAALLYSDAGFAQVLEGPRDVVERTFERIATDPRHTDVTVLSFTPTQRRSFPDWPMGFCGQMPLVAADPLPSATGGSVLSGQRVTTSSDVLRLLERIVQQEEAWIGI